MGGLGIKWLLLPDFSRLGSKSPLYHFFLSDAKTDADALSWLISFDFFGNLTKEREPVDVLVGKLEVVDGLIDDGSFILDGKRRHVCK